jgi:hypothetical protein
MFLIYGQNAAGELVRIDRVKSGKTDLRCPYCAGPLIARRGKILADHFAHAGETCRPVSGGQAALVLLDFELFRQSLSGPQARDLDKLRELGRVFTAPSQVRPAMMSTLTRLGFVAAVPAADLKRPLYWLTPRAQAFFLTLDPAWWLKFVFEETRLALATAPDEVTARLLRAEIERREGMALYFLRVHGVAEVYKIGFTTRPIVARLVKIKWELDRELPRNEIKLELLRYKPGCGAVEGYLKAFWAAALAPLGSHQEYFVFNAVQPALALLDRIEPPEPRPAPEPGRQVYRALFGTVEHIRNDFTSRLEDWLRFVEVRDQHGNRFAASVVFRPGKMFDDLKLKPGDLVEFTATPETDRLLRPAGITIIAGAA